MKKLSLNLLLALLVLNINAQKTKVISSTDWYSQFSEYATIKKSVIDEPPYLQHGKTEIWIKGNLIAMSNYSNGERDGESIEYIDVYGRPCNGKPMKVTNYKKGEKTSEKFFRCEQKDGRQLYYADNENHYKNGKLDRVIKYYTNGKMESSLADYGLCTYWYENGNKKKEYTLNGRYNNNGEYKEWNEDGSLHVSGLYENRKKAGEWTFYKANNMIDVVDVYENGESVSQKRYGDNGKITSIWDIKSDIVKVFEDDKLLSFGKYEKGDLQKPRGEHKVYNIDGTISKYVYYNYSGTVTKELTQAEYDEEQRIKELEKEIDLLTKKIYNVHKELLEELVVNPDDPPSKMKPIKDKKYLYESTSIIYDKLRPEFINTGDADKKYELGKTLEANLTRLVELARNHTKDKDKLVNGITDMQALLEALGN